MKLTRCKTAIVNHRSCIQCGEKGKCLFIEQFEDRPKKRRYFCIECIIKRMDKIEEKENEQGQLLPDMLAGDAVKEPEVKETGIGDRTGTGRAGNKKPAGKKVSDNRGVGNSGGRAN